MSVDEIVRLLGLAPHPEGGYYRETFRDAPAEGSRRAASTAIYFLLPQGQVSRWHRVDACEAWHWYAGSPLKLSIVPDGQTEVANIRLGADLLAGERPQYVVQRSVWQQARSLGAWSLVGCTVAPGFEFSGFEMAPVGFDPVNDEGWLDSR